MWVSFAFGLMGWLSYFNQRRPIAGAITAAFFALAGLSLRTGSRRAIFSVFAFFAFACAACVVPFGLTPSLACLALAPILLIGSVKAAHSLARNFEAPIGGKSGWQLRVKKLWVALSPFPGIVFAALGISASVAVLFGTVLALYPMGADKSMEPNLHDGDWITSVNAPLMGVVHRGDLVAFSYWDVTGTERVVGLPGDRIQVRSGTLIRNGKAVTEPYCRLPYRGGLGDFPQPSAAYPDGFLRCQHRNAYGDTLKRGAALVVPAGSYFLLNDDRNELLDSRIFGPVWNNNVVGRPFLAYHADHDIQSRPRLVH